MTRRLCAFAVAIALALVVWRCCKRPRGSDGGDRILVDKFRWLRGDPHRWEPTVFQYPLDRSTNFIKRIEEANK